MLFFFKNFRKNSKIFVFFRPEGRWSNSDCYQCCADQNNCMYSPNPTPVAIWVPEFIEEWAYGIWSLFQLFTFPNIFAFKLFMCLIANKVNLFHGVQKPEKKCRIYFHVFTSVFNRLLTNIWLFFHHFLTDFWPFSSDFWQIFERFLTDIWLIFSTVFDRFFNNTIF